MAKKDTRTWEQKLVFILLTDPKNVFSRKSMKAVERLVPLWEAVPDAPVQTIKVKAK